MYCGKIYLDGKLIGTMSWSYSGMSREIIPIKNKEGYFKVGDIDDFGKISIQGESISEEQIAILSELQSKNTIPDIKLFQGDSGKALEFEKEIPHGLKITKLEKKGSTVNVELDVIKGFLSF